MRAKACLAGLLLIVPSVAFAAPGVINTYSVTVRDQPSTEANTSGYVKLGDEVDFTPTHKNAWVKVQFKGGTGYMVKKYVTPATMAAAATLPGTPTPPVTEKKAPAPTVAKITKKTPAKTPTPAAKPVPAAAPAQIFEIITEPSAEEILKKENSRLSEKVKELTSASEKNQVQIRTLEAGIKKSAAEATISNDELKKKAVLLATASDTLAGLRSKMPSIELIDANDKKGQEVMLKDIGKARMLTAGAKTVISVDESGSANADAALRSICEERIRGTVDGKATIYYVLNTKAIRAAR